MGPGVRRDDVELPALSRAAARRRGRGCRRAGRRAAPLAHARRARAALQSLLPRRASCTIAAACRSMPRRTLAPVMKELGWHMQLWIDVKDLPDTIPILKEIGLPVVIDHMGRTDARARHVGARVPEPAAPARQGVCGWRLRARHSGLARAAHRVSERLARPVRGAGARANPVRLLWGCNWPRPPPGRRDAERRAPARPVQRVDARRRDRRAHPGGQSGEAVRFSALRR